jgi:hypothetical protein
MFAHCFLLIVHSLRMACSLTVEAASPFVTLLKSVGQLSEMTSTSRPATIGTPKTTTLRSGAIF